MGTCALLISPPSISSFSCMDGTMAQVVSLSVIPEGNRFLSRPLKAATENEDALVLSFPGCQEASL